MQKSLLRNAVISLIASVVLVTVIGTLTYEMYVNATPTAAIVLSQPRLDPYMDILNFTRYALCKTMVEPSLQGKTLVDYKKYFGQLYAPLNVQNLVNSMSNDPFFNSAAKDIVLGLRTYKTVLDTPNDYGFVTSYSPGQHISGHPDVNIGEPSPPAVSPD